MPASNKVIEFLLLGVAFVWALNFSVSKMSLQEIDPMSFNAMRFFLATLLMWGFTLRSGRWVPLRPGDWSRLIVLGLLGNLVYQLLFIFGLNRTFSANSAVMLGTIPIWVAVLSHLSGAEKMSRFKAVGVALAFTGVLLILLGKPERISLSSETFTGDLLTLAAAFVFGSYTVMSKGFLNYYPPIQLTTMSMTVGGTSLVLVGLPWVLELDFTQISALALGGVLYNGLLSVGVSYIIWNYGLRQVGAVRTATYQNLVPVLGLILGFLILGEQLTLVQYAGSAVVIAGIVIARHK
ncbi:MAG: DMT superfamily drug/metabolite transporter [Bacteroidetes bacterium HLUCCA01]|nr:MAG: DMT superfamily drug/metabolite transporter [Bacteroidetes bacterium HLUCCA01]